MYAQEGASLRLLHPQRYFPHLAHRMALLEQTFNSCVGCNAYLTPPDSQVPTYWSSAYLGVVHCLSPWLSV